MSASMRQGFHVVQFAPSATYARDLARSQTVAATLAAIARALHEEVALETVLIRADCLMPVRHRRQLYGRSGVQIKWNIMHFGCITLEGWFPISVRQKIPTAYHREIMQDFT